MNFAVPFRGQYLFIVLDSLSKWVEVFLTKEISSHYVIRKLRSLFCKFGLVDIVISDNGRQLTSEIFKEFLLKNNIIHILTPSG